MKNNGPVYNLTTGKINFPIDDRVAIDPEGHMSKKPIRGGKNMRHLVEKSVLFLLLVAMVFSFVGCGNASFLMFNGIPFGKTHKEVMSQIEKKLLEQGYEGKARKSINHLTGLTRYSEQFDNVQLDDYTADYLTLQFIDKDDNNGTVDDAQFYEAYYTFVFPTQSQASDALEYFRDKYVKIYGKPSYENLDSPVVQKCRWDNSDNTAMFVIITPAIKDFPVA